MANEGPEVTAMLATCSTNRALAHSKLGDHGAAVTARGAKGLASYDWP